MTFAKAQTAVFEGDLKQSKRITFEAWRERPLREKVVEHLAALLAAQL